MTDILQASYVGALSKSDLDPEEVDRVIDKRAKGKNPRELEDQAAYAAAIREGNPEPEQSAVAKLEAEVQATRRRQGALAAALADLEKEKAVVVDQHRDTWAGEVDERIGTSASALEGAVAAVESERARLLALRELRTWLGEPAKPFSPSEAGSAVYVMSGGLRHHRSTPPTLAEIRGEARGESTTRSDQSRAGLGGWVSVSK